MQDFTVKRPHQGDKFYNRGDTRSADPRKVAHLVRKGVLVLVDDEQGKEEGTVGSKDKSEPPAERKPEPQTKTKTETTDAVSKALGLSEAQTGAAADKAAADKAAGVKT